VNFVARDSTPMLNIKDIWAGTTEGKSTNVKRVGRNFQRSSIWYVIRRYMTQKGIKNASHVKRVGKASSLRANS
jgi:nicotinamide riboside kinase